MSKAHSIFQQGKVVSKNVQMLPNRMRDKGELNEIFRIEPIEITLALSKLFVYIRVQFISILSGLIHIF